MLAREGHHAFDDTDMADWLLFAFFFDGDVKGRVRGVRDQATLVGVQRVENTFACKGVGFENIKRAGIDSETTRVLQPERAPNFLLLIFIPQ